MKWIAFEKVSIILNIVFFLTEEETENEKNRQNFLDWKEKLEV
jgi:hypothetical protein